VQNTRRLVDAAVEAGVRRIVHLSITNPESSSLAYFVGKARAERLVRQSSLSYGIVRPTVLFGGDGVLINNMAWLLRRVPGSQSPALVTTGSDQFTWTTSLQSQ
jgi:NADH dehydrogenase